MSIRRLFLTLTCLTAAGGLVIGSRSQFRPVAIGLILLMAVLWVIKPVRQNPWAASINLGVFLCAAAASMLGGGQAAWLAIGGMTALASWDLVSCEQSIAGAEKNEGLRRWETEHIKTLTITLVLSAVLLLPFLIIRFQIPFAIMFSALAAVFAGLLLASRIINKNNTP